ncbi:TetR/AcrR family transcriptional regulator [Amycolatopsis anabasis]|uniref:TetR/AcrR family transcriptional regulator n=1 Tax=Amycolatopsis anabasis TaxID=1840409 RepID=UPI00131DE818|nr:TetR/AcrR family transcriptional regulator [Amycolatopsis anabasis]
MTDASSTSDTEGRFARADRILDAAADLLLHLGYRRVTVEDVAERAGIGKGTVYLHWKTRQDLFLAVLQREVVASLDELVEALRSDPATALLHRLTKIHFTNVLRRPLLRAVYTTDPEVLGKLAKALHDLQHPRHHEAFDDYLALLAKHDLLRTDLTVREISYAYHATLHGFLLTDSYNGGRTAEPTEHKADLLATTVQHAFEPTRPAPAKALRAVGPRAIELFAESADLDRTRLHSAYA